MEEIKGPNKYNTLWLRVKSSKQCEKVMAILRNELSAGDEVVFMPNPDDLPNFTRRSCVLRWHDATANILEVDCYNAPNG